MSRPDKFCFPVRDTISAQPSSDPIRFDVNLRLRLDDDGRAGAGHWFQSPKGVPSQSDLVRLACRIYDARRTRDRLLGSKMFGEPAWDMLLACYCLPARGEKLSVTGIAYAANLPATTGHRWLGILEEKGLIERAVGGRDARRQVVRLTRNGREMLEDYLSRLLYCETPLPPHPQDAGG